MVVVLGDRGVNFLILILKFQFCDICTLNTKELC